MQPNYKQRRGTWDTIYSTYFWKIHLDKDNPNNLAESLSGYSKKIGENEAQDKEYLLKKKIVNLYTNGYFTKATHIQFFCKVGPLIDKSRDPKIITLYPTHYVIEQFNFEIVNKKWGRWLTDFYFRINNNKSLDDILPALRRPKSKDDYLDITKQHFTSEAQLYNYCAKLSLHGHPPGEVKHFIEKYRELRKW